MSCFTEMKSSVMENIWTLTPHHLADVQDTVKTIAKKQLYNNGLHPIRYRSNVSNHNQLKLRRAIKFATDNANSSLMFTYILHINNMLTGNGSDCLMLTRGSV